MFTIPEHSVAALRAMFAADTRKLAEAVFMWGIHMDSFSTPHYVETGEYLFEKQLELNRTEFNCHEEDTEKCIMWRNILLNETFEKTIRIPVSITDSVVVRADAEFFHISLDSIGRLNTWVWIDQNETVQIARDNIDAALAAIEDKFIKLA